MLHINTVLDTVCSNWTSFLFRVYRMPSKEVVHYIKCFKKCCPVKQVGWINVKAAAGISFSLSVCEGLLRHFSFFLQSSKVKLWWPNGHGERPFYHVAVRGFQDGFLILDTESKVRLHCLSALTLFSYILFRHLDDAFVPDRNMCSSKTSSKEWASSVRLVLVTHRRKNGIYLLFWNLFVCYLLAQELLIDVRKSCT